MAAFLRGETVICSIEVKNSAGTYVDPATSMKISIFDKANGAEVNDVTMTKDAVGKYHYDYTLSATALLGNYTVKYKATDVSRITMLQDSFEVK